MNMIDITTEAFTSPSYAEDPPAKFKWHRSIDSGDDYNLSVFRMTPHTGTHIDAPSHFIDGAENIDEIDLSKCVGTCTVVTIQGVLTGEDMDELLPCCKKRLLIHGDGEAVLELSAARVLAEHGIKLIGTDAVSISFYKQEIEVHKELLSNGIVILENLCLDNVPDDDYVLSALPIKLGGLEAAPVRAVLFDIPEQKNKKR